MKVASLISVFVVLSMVLLIEQGQAAINCGQVDASLAPCMPYLTQGGSPSPLCCTGVKAIRGMVTTPDEKREACNCVKTAANRYPSLKDDAAQALPDKCGVKLDIPISRSTNCDVLN